MHIILSRRMAPQRAAPSRTVSVWLLTVCVGLGAVFLFGCGVQGTSEVQLLRGASDGLSSFADCSGHPFCAEFDRVQSPVDQSSSRGAVERVVAAAGSKNITGPNCQVASGAVAHGPFGGNSSLSLAFDVGNYRSRPITRIWWRASKTDLVALYINFQGGTVLGSVEIPAGGNWGTSGVAYLDFGEYIVSATVGWSFKVHGIVFTTNTGRTIEVGAPRANWPPKAIATSSPNCGDTSNYVLMTVTGKYVPGGCVEQISLLWALPVAAKTPENNGVFVRGVASATAPWKSSPFPDPKASVIWYSTDGVSASTASAPPMPTFYKTFTAVGPYAYLHVLANQFAQVYFNGLKVGAFWGSTYDGSPVKVPLRSGAPNTIMVQCASADASGGLAVSLLSRFNRTVIVRTDSSWRYFLNPAVRELRNLTGAPAFYNTIPGASNFTFPSENAKWVWLPEGDLQLPRNLNGFAMTYYNAGPDVTVTFDMLTGSSLGVQVNGFNILSFEMTQWRRRCTFTLRGSFLNIIYLFVSYGTYPVGFKSAMYVTSSSEVLAVSNEATWTNIYYGPAKWAPF